MAKQKKKVGTDLFSKNRNPNDKEVISKAVEAEQKVQEQTEEIESPSPTLSEEKKKRPTKTKTGYIRYGIIIKEDSLRRLQDIHQQTGLPMKKLINQAVEKYLETWTDERIKKVSEIFLDD